MKVILCFPYLLLVATIATAQNPTNQRVEPISWQQYIKDCGVAPQKENSARTEHVFKQKYQGKEVHWVGVVDGVDKKPFGNGYIVRVMMNPTESALGTYDLSLSASEVISEEVVALNKRDKVTFDGSLTRQGGVFLPHEVQITSIRPFKDESKPKERPQKSQKAEPGRASEDDERSVDEKMAKAAMNLGKVYLKQGKMKEAKEYLEKVIKIMPDSKLAEEARTLLDTITVETDKV